MISERLKKLIELLKEKTLSKKTIWNKTSGHGQFKLSISDGSAVTVTEWSDNYNTGYEVVIFNSNGDAIERFSTETEDTSKEEQYLIQSFHKAASDSYYKVEETMDALLNSIINQDIIGNAESPIPPPPGEDDDLPF